MGEDFERFDAGTQLSTQVPGVSFIGKPTIAAPATFAPSSGKKAVYGPACDPDPSCGGTGHQLTFDLTEPATSVSLWLGYPDSETPDEQNLDWGRLIGYDKTGTEIAASDDTKLSTKGFVAVTLTDGKSRIRRVVITVGAGTAGHDTKPRRVAFDDLAIERPAPPATSNGGSTSGTTTQVDPGPNPRGVPGFVFSFDPRQFVDQRVIASDVVRLLGRPPRIEITSLRFFDFDRGGTSDGDLRASYHAPEGDPGFCFVVDPPDDYQCRPDARFRGTDPSSIATGRGLQNVRVGVHRVVAFIVDARGNVASDERVVDVQPLANVDLRVTGLEVTQATQHRTVPSRWVNSGGRWHETDAVDYVGVPLVAAKRTAVRVYANAISAGGTRTAVRNVEAVLRGYAQRADGSRGAELPGSPVRPVRGPAELVRSGDSIATLRERTQSERSANGYTFLLPWEWARGEIQLEAELNPATAAARVHECPTCGANNRLTVRRVKFHRTKVRVISPIGSFYDDATGRHYVNPNLEQVFERTREVTPLPDANLLIRPYAGYVDLTRIRRCDEADRRGGTNRCYGTSDDDKNTSVWDAMSDFYRANTGLPGLPLGINEGIGRGLAMPICCGFESGFIGRFGIADQGRPLTSVAHEWYHEVGHQHASGYCGAALATGWPPDERGYLNSVGIDLDPGSGGEPTLFRTYGASSQQIYDLMSYGPGCDPSARLRGIEDLVWISTRNWTSTLQGNIIIDGFADESVRVTAPEGSRALAASADGPTLVVSARLGRDRVEGLRVVPGVEGAELSASAASTFHVLTKRADGGVIADVGVAPLLAGEDEPEPMVLVQAQVAATDVARVELVVNGQLVASATRSANPPTVRLVAPTAGAKVGLTASTNVRATGTSRVAWEASDADGDALNASVDLSTDGGSTWRTLITGVAGNETTVPNRLFTASTSARIRVRVHDGFHTAEVVSGPLTAVGAPPEVRVLAGPREIPADAPLLLSGQAFDPAGDPITGRRLAWFDGKRRLGTGAQVTATGLPAGRRTIRLVATVGKTRGQATVRVRVLAVKPRFRVLAAPRRLARSARAVVLRVASTVAARLSVGGLRRSVGLRTVRLVVPVRPGRSPLVLRLRLSAGGRSTTVVVRIPRRG